MSREARMIILRFIERNMDENMELAVSFYNRHNKYADAHKLMERVCAYGNARKILLDGGTKEDIFNLAEEYEGTGKTHIWYAYYNTAKEIENIEHFLKHWLWCR